VILLSILVVDSILIALCYAVDNLRIGDVESDVLHLVMLPPKCISVELLLRSDEAVIASLRRPIPDEALQFASS